MKRILVLLTAMTFLSGCIILDSPQIVKLKDYSNHRYDRSHDSLSWYKGVSWNQIGFRYPIMIQEYGVYRIDAQGGAQVMMNIFNCRDNIIKYIYITITPYNIFDEIQFCNLDYSSTKIIKITGPINKNTMEQMHISLYESSKLNFGIRRYWNPLWYNPSIRRIKISSITVIYSDDTRIRFLESEIEDMLEEAKKPYKKERG